MTPVNFIPLTSHLSPLLLPQPRWPSSTLSSPTHPCRHTPEGVSHSLTLLQTYPNNLKASLSLSLASFPIVFLLLLLLRLFPKLHRTDSHAIRIYSFKYPQIGTIFLPCSTHQSSLTSHQTLCFIDTGFKPSLIPFIRTLLPQDVYRSSELLALRRLSWPDSRGRKVAVLRIEVLPRLFGDLPPSVTRK